jgi:hypothetical protein
VPGKREVSPLHAELESFGRRARRLTADRLQDQKFLGVLVALFGQEALVDADQRQILAERVERAILAIIAGINDREDRRIAEIVFAAKPEFYDLNVTERQSKSEELGGPIRELFKTRRARIVGDVTFALKRTFNSQTTTSYDVALSQQARPTARQLYRYAQQALICIEAFDLCQKYATRLETIFARARAAQVDVRDARHAWLVKYLKDGERVRLVSRSRDSWSDRGIWALAYFHRYLRALLQDHTGRDYLRETLPVRCWDDIHLTAVLLPNEVDTLLSVLEEHQIETAGDFVDNLCEDAQGRSAHEHWLEYISNGILITPASRQVVQLLKLCVSLQHIFPDETVDPPGIDFEIAVEAIITQGAEEMWATHSGDTSDISGLINEAFDYKPPRYFLSWDREWSEQDGENDGGDVWSEKLPVLDVFDLFD